MRLAAHRKSASSLLHEPFTIFRDIRECIENASMVYSSSQSLLKSDDFTMLKGASLALERIEGVFINPPPTSPRANDDLAWEFSDDVREEIVSHLGGYGNLRPSK